MSVSSGARLTIERTRSKDAVMDVRWSGTGLEKETAARVNAAIALASARSACTCEECGEVGRQFRSDERFLTACDRHKGGRAIEIQPSWPLLRVVRDIVGGRARIISCRRYDRSSDTFLDTSPSELGIPEKLNMARFRCRACGEEGLCVYDGQHKCPRRGSIDVQFALSIEELADNDPLITALTALAENELPDADD